MHRVFFNFEYKKFKLACFSKLFTWKFVNLYLVSEKFRVFELEILADTL